MAVRDPEKPRRRWLRFSLGTLLIAMCSMGLALGWLGTVLVRIREQRSLIAKLRSLDSKLIDREGLLFGRRPLSDSEWTRWPLDDELVTHLPGIALERPDLKDADLKVLATFTGLRSLYIEDGPGVTDNGIQHLAKSSKLCNVALFNTRVTAGGLSHLPARDSIRILWIGGPLVTDESLAQLDQLSNLSDLSIGDSRGITDAGMAHIANLRRLESLSIAKIPITDQGLQHLSSLTRLRSLTLRGEGVSDAGMQHIAQLTELVSLRLGETNVGDTGVTHLTALNKLGYLDLMPSAITDAGLQSLAKMSSLRHLALGRSVTRAGAVELKASLPQCEIWFWENNNWATLK